MGFQDSCCWNISVSSLAIPAEKHTKMPLKALPTPALLQLLSVWIIRNDNKLDWNITLDQTGRNHFSCQKSSQWEPSYPNQYPSFTGVWFCYPNVQVKYQNSACTTSWNIQSLLHTAERKINFLHTAAHVPKIQHLYTQLSTDGLKLSQYDASLLFPTKKTCESYVDCQNFVTKTCML